MKITDYHKKILEIRNKKHLVEKFESRPVEIIPSNERIKGLQERVKSLETQSQESQGGGRALHPEYATWGELMKVAAWRGGAILSYNQLRRIYRQSSVVRPCVDGIARVISSFDWNILPKDPLNPNWEHINVVKDFFNNPNLNKESLQQLISKFLTDILVLDAGVIEKVRSLSGKLLEIYVRDGATFRPQIDKHSLQLGYVQQVGGTEVNFAPNDIVYFMLYPRSDSAYGTPIIDSIVDEVASLLFSNKFIAASFTEDEIPAGILNLGKIGKEAYDRAKQDFEEKRGKRKRFGITVVRGTEKIDWLTLNRTNEELELDELRKSIEKIVYRNFGVSPTEMGVTDKTPRATAKIQLEVSSSKLILPIAKLINYFFNMEVVPELGFDDVYFKLIPSKQEDPLAQAKIDEIYLKKGVKVIDEVRGGLGLPPHKKGGDRPFIILGNEIKYIDEISSEKKKVEPIEIHEEEAEEEEEESEIKEAGERAPPNAMDLDAIKELEKIYGTELRKEWDIAKKASLASPKKSEEIISKMGDRWVEISKTYFPIAYSIGQDCACQILRSSSQVGTEKIISSLEERISWNKKFVKTSLEKALIEKSTKLVEKVEYDDMGEVFDSLESRVENYEHAVYSSAGKGMDDEFAIRGEQVLYYWKTGSGHPCSDCVDLEIGSPYLPRELQILPGDGTTKCTGWCYCQILVHRTGEPMLPGTITEPPRNMLPPKMLKVESSKILKSDLKMRYKPMEKEKLDKYYNKFLDSDDKKVIKKFDEIFNNPRLRGTLLKEKYFENLKTINVDYLESTFGYRGAYEKGQMGLDVLKATPGTFAHEFGHHISIGNKRFRFLFQKNNRTTSKVLKAYQKSVESWLKELKTFKKGKYLKYQKIMEEDYLTVFDKGRQFDDPIFSYWGKAGTKKYPLFADYFTSYSLTSPCEYIAEGFEGYITRPEVLKAADKNLYKLIDNFLKKGKL